ncbi:hypothetical protein E0F26_00740 [Candidatus Paraluminiphilus aquimaris]|uniref:Uncharacterized protein n=1 Tax=Candidatus Paraluminiphilus aquimaris TaxID=2518994 RepID=A0ABY6Q888_9GAMM|nr:hypothetical protein E0F26_00740 [Candidatus Paraluminiphilus aquimaris]
MCARCFHLFFSAGRVHDGWRCYQNMQARKGQMR